MGVNRIHPLRLAAPALAAGDWHYLPLRAIEVLGAPAEPTLRLTLEEDEGGVMHTIYCSAADQQHLDPYILQLRSWESDPLANEIPLLPVTLSDDGRPSFCAAAVAHDFPEFVPPKRRRTTVHLSHELADQIQTVSKSLRMSKAELVLSMILKSTTKAG